MSSNLPPINVSSLYSDDGYRNYILRERLDELRLLPEVHQSKQFLALGFSGQQSVAQHLYQTDWWIITDAASNPEVALIKANPHSSFAMFSSKSELKVVSESEFQNINVLNLSALPNGVGLLRRLSLSASWRLWLRSGDIYKSKALWESSAGEKTLKQLMWCLPKDNTGVGQPLISLLEKLRDDDMSILDIIGPERVEDFALELQQWFTMFSEYTYVGRSEYFEAFILDSVKRLEEISVNSDCIGPVLLKQLECVSAILGNISFFESPHVLAVFGLSGRLISSTYENIIDTAHLLVKRALICDTLDFEWQMASNDKLKHLGPVLIKVRSGAHFDDAEDHVNEVSEQGFQPY